MSRQPELTTLSEARALACHGLRDLFRELDISEATWVEQVDAFLAGRAETIRLTYVRGDFRFEQTSEFVKDLRTDASPAWDVYRWRVVSRVTFDGYTAESPAVAGYIPVRRLVPLRKGAA